MRTIHPFKPIYDKNSKILILGTMPSNKSVTNNFYYGNPQNRFWTALQALFNVELNSNEEKTDFLLKNKIALWDTIESCEITGSSDSSIKNIKVNNIKKLIDETKIKYIFCTGKKSFAIYNKFLRNITKIEAICLPSPSPANAAISLNKLVEEYKVITSTLKDVL